ncbi:MAG: DUF2784 domain-containing protein [Moraxellaceae bacterium]|nr:DUF2784 domain-containing protein [Moraxellaceae bacterium]
MIWRTLADAVLVLHLAFVLFALLGGLLALRWRWLAWLHLPALAWGMWIELSGGICPLTPVENALRQRGGEAGYAGGFIEHYLLPLLYPPGLTRETQWVLAAVLAAVNLAVYCRLLWRRG